MGAVTISRYGYIEEVESERDRYKAWAYRFRDLLEPFAWMDGIDHPNDTEKAIIEFDEENAKSDSQRPDQKTMNAPKTDEVTMLSPGTFPRFRIEKRSGIVAIYDTQHPEYEQTAGCHADYPWVVCSWGGRYVTPPDTECLNGCGHWTVEKRWIEKAHQTLDLLNSLCANERGMARPDGGQPDHSNT